MNFLTGQISNNKVSTPIGEIPLLGAFGLTGGNPRRQFLAFPVDFR